MNKNLPSGAVVAAVVVAIVAIVGAGMWFTKANAPIQMPSRPPVGMEKIKALRTAQHP